MTRLTDNLRAGQPSRKVLARGSGQRGQIDLNWFSYSRAKYLALIRAEQESELLLTIYYGP